MHSFGRLQRENKRKAMGLQDLGAMATAVLSRQTAPP
jgi:hypothetical protein